MYFTVTPLSFASQDRITKTMTNYPAPIAPGDYFDAKDLGIDDANITVDIAEDTDGVTLTAVINVTEPLAFHASHSPEHFTAEGVLTAEALETLEALISNRYKGEYLEEGGEGDEAVIRFSIALDVPASTTEEELGNLIWEKSSLIDFINESDPGTFGSPYLFGTLMTEQG